MGGVLPISAKCLCNNVVFTTEKSWVRNVDMLSDVTAGVISLQDLRLRHLADAVVQSHLQ